MMTTRNIATRPASSARNRMRRAFEFAANAARSQEVADAAFARGDYEMAVTWGNIAATWSDAVKNEAKWAFHYAAVALERREGR